MDVIVLVEPENLKMMNTAHQDGDAGDMDTFATFPAAKPQVTAEKTTMMPSEKKVGGAYDTWDTFAATKDAISQDTTILNKWIPREGSSAGGAKIMEDHARQADARIMDWRRDRSMTSDLRAPDVRSMVGSRRRKCPELLLNVRGWLKWNLEDQPRTRSKRQG